MAFAAATSIATIGLYISYCIPILIGAIYHRDFVARKGPFNLRWASRPVAIVGVMWTGFITIIFCLPTVNPVNSQTLNYTVVAVGIVTIGSLGSWFISARKWFVGPVKEIEGARISGSDTAITEEVEVDKQASHNIVKK